MNSPFSLSTCAKVSIVLATLGLVVLSTTIWTTQTAGAQGGAGAISFTQSNYNVNENGGNASVTLSRTGGSTGRVTAKVSLADVTTSPADYTFKPGSPDLSFPTQQLSFFYHGSQSIAQQPDGKIVLASSRVRLTADGTVDSTFNAPSFNDPPYSAAVQADGKVVFVGDFTSIGGVHRNGVVRLNSNGSLDTSFDPGFGGGGGEEIVFQADGKILIGGLIDSFNQNNQYNRLVRLNTDGSLDTSFVVAPTNVGNVYALAIQPDGKILMGGYGVFRLNNDGSLDNTFNSFTNFSMYLDVITVQPDGKILIGGYFSQAQGQTIYNIARLNSDGNLDTSFNTGSGPDGSVSAITLQPDGKILIGGTFDFFNGTSKPRIARLNSDGTLDNAFAGIGSVSGTEVAAILMQGNGKLVASGFFSFKTSPVQYWVLARFNGDLLATWGDGDSADKTITIPIVDDAIDEPDETASLSLTAYGGAAGGAITNATLTILDNEVPPVITSPPPPAQGLTRTSYSHTFTATGSPAPTFSVTAGTLPPGLFLQFNGLLTGTPTTAGTFSGITVTASNGLSPAATQTFDITILSGGTLQFSSSSYTVAENGGAALITVTRANGSAGTTSVSYFTSGTPTDFTSTSGTLVFAEGETTKTFSVPIVDDALDEDDETFVVVLTNVTGTGALGSPSASTVRILDDDPPPSLTLGDGVQLEGNSGTRAIQFFVTLSAVSGRQVSFSYTTVDGTASAGPDFVATSGSSSIFAGQSVALITVPILGDTAVEPDETFSVKLTTVQNATVGRGTATGTIISDESATGNAIDLNGFFVYQHYVDFLSRNPDADGFNFWVGELTSCGTNPQCLEVKKVNVSAAFFLSIEFQETGYLVERLYKTSFGDATGNSTFPTPHQLQVPIVRFSEFFNDTFTIGSGVIVGQPGWEQALENNKQTFTNSFVQRIRFLTDYPTGMSAADFVDKLNGRAGNPLSQSERDQLVSGLSSGAKTRAQVLRAVAEHPNLVNSERNRAFVLSQFFGYLRRNPNDSPDGDYTGYDFWLTKLNDFNGNFINAEMVKAFLSSAEYRKRFGQ
jgi:uncharacterized delta-60 repeat protein